MSNAHNLVRVDVAQFPALEALDVPDFNPERLVPELQAFGVVLPGGRTSLLLPLKLQGFLFIVPPSLGVFSTPCRTTCSVFTQLQPRLTRVVLLPFFPSPVLLCSNCSL